MTRENTLKNIANNKPKSTPAPEMPQGIIYQDKTAMFRESLEIASGHSQFITNFDEIQFDKNKVVLSEIAQIPSCNIENITDEHSCQNIDFYIVKGQFGVSENAAIWLDDSNLSHRSALFLTQDLIIIIDENKLVSNMHEAYEQITLQDKSFGVFIAGPSKTADIEQSLVVGAHGARTLTVYIKKGK